MEKVEVLLSYYKGNKYLRKLLESLQRQKGNLDLKITLRNDGSDSIDEKNLYGINNIVIINGQNIGVKRSFFELIRGSEDDADYFCFCDQDDVWDDDKLESALVKLRIYEDQPAMYFSKTRLVDENLNYLGQDTFEKGEFSFGRTLIKNNAVGCTIVFNRKLRDVMKKAIEKYEITTDSLLHDHILYMVCTGIGGEVIYDLKPHISYRQHSNNAIGNRENLLEKLISNGLFNKDNVRLRWAEELYSNFANVLTEENRLFLLQVLNYKKNLRNRWKLMITSEFQVQSFFERINIVMLLIFGKF
ncbi:glycosyltransferase [Enterococcus dongliensis]|uniref:glycosyltransferase n=1 Tax=Enterococcus dongliensis TaxID=2559925 RepID=UPI00288FAA8A|nr:glycosyltransferase [Enterococcus dongliensis]MDT2634765.1 glycosyltransferase [Enterococcus dongliensis]MDT2669254.1 glycosyltransferase [Enterococcus dongliensis]